MPVLILYTLVQNELATTSSSRIIIPEVLGHTTKRNYKGSEQGNKQTSSGHYHAMRSSALGTSVAQFPLNFFRCELCRRLVETVCPRPENPYCHLG